MRFLVLSHHLPPNYNAGAELYALGQCQWLQSKGHTVQAIAIEDIEASVPKLEARCDIYQEVTVHRLFFDRLNYANPFEVSHDNPEIEKWLAGFLEEFRPDIMLVNACYLFGVGVLRAARQLGIPTVVYLHDFWFLCQRITLMRPDGTLCSGNVNAETCAACISQDKRAHLWADRLSLGQASRTLAAGSKAGFEPFTDLLGGRQKIETLKLRRQRLLRALEEADQVIAPSLYLKKVFEENGFPKDKILYSRYSQDENRLAALVAARERRLTTSPGNLRVGFLGQTKPHKGVHLLVKAFRKINAEGARLSIHGRFDETDKYHRHLKKLAGSDERIKFAGPYHREQLPEILENLDVVVVPSVWLENSPLVIMEAQAAGLPVITTNLGGMAEMVRPEQNGLLFARNDVADLTRQLKRLIDEPGLVRKLAERIPPAKTTGQEYAELMPIFERLAPTARPLSLS
ncbi:MAG: glycosyltransferase family 4 protein [Chloroflexi bacterium]|nr:glycosyltransferase family 4 protein [Chloroflexota bacterium]OJW03415.1 MAG: hypothetical protein BGO39_10425 [Chloroflexi bacterium 54-19]